MINRFKCNAVLALMLSSVGALAQGTATYGGDIPATFRISNTTNGDLADTASFAFGNLAIGATSSPVTKTLAFRLRSNAAYKLTAAATFVSGITDATRSLAGTTAQAIKSGDIGFGFTAALDSSGASVVGTRDDAIVLGYDVSGGWASITNGHTPTYGKTLNDLATTVQILSGKRISASGNNTSDDNFILATVGIQTLPQYLTPVTNFNGVITFTISAP